MSVAATRQKVECSDCHTTFDPNEFIRCPDCGGEPE